LIAMLALQLELANIRHQVTEPLLGQIRLSWWRNSCRRCHRLPLVDIRFCKSWWQRGRNCPLPGWITC
jgi:hypothetical protein